MARTLQALDEMVIDGIKTNIPLHKDLLTDPVEIKGGASIHYLEHKLGLVQEKSADKSKEDAK